MGLLELITAISIIVSGNAYHFDRPNNLNEKNNIVGIEAEVENVGAYYKQATNSYNKQS